MTPQTRYNRHLNLFKRPLVQADYFNFIKSMDYTLTGASLYNFELEYEFYLLPTQSTWWALPLVFENISIYISYYYGCLGYICTYVNGSAKDLQGYHYSANKKLLHSIVTWDKALIYLDGSLLKQVNLVYNGTISDKNLSKIHFSRFQSGANYTNLQCKYFTLRNKTSNQTLLDLRPYYRPNGTVCPYDLVSKQFLWKFIL